MNSLTRDQRNMIAGAVGTTISTIRKELEEVLLQVQANVTAFEEVNEKMAKLNKDWKEKKMDEQTFERTLNALDAERDALHEKENQLRDKRRELAEKLEAAQGAFNALIQECSTVQR